MIKYYNSLSWRLGTSLKTREPDGVGQSSNFQFSMPRWSWLTTIFIVLMVFTGGNVWSQVSTYTFAESTEVYAQISGTTSTAIGDDGTQVDIPIGFSFNFGGVNYTTFSITTNGMIKLGGGPIATGWTNLLDNSAVLRPLIAPFWDDNNLSTGTIRYSTTGSVGSRVLAINWHNTKIGSVGSTAGASVSTILRLYETTNVVEMIYGSPFTTTNTVSASVGLNDMTSFLSVTPAATSTASGITANNAINAAAMANLAGKKFTFTPPVILMPPSCATALSPANSATDVARNTGLSWTAATGGPLSYDIYLGTSTPAPLFANVGSTSYTLPALLNANTVYYYKIVPKNGNGDAVGCVEQTFTTGSNVVYCASGATSTADTRVATLTLGGDTRAGEAGCTTYTDRTATAPFLISKQAPTAFSITLGSCSSFTYGSYAKVYIDYNMNGAFDVDELVYSAALLSPPSPQNGTITLPESAVLGNTRMRVVLREGGDASTTQACGTYVYGETQDYTVTILPPPSCFSPTSLAAAINFSVPSANVSWVAPSDGDAPIGYEYAVTTSATPPASGDFTSDTNASVGPLVANTTYYLHVRSECVADTEFSSWTSISFFTGYCDPVYTTGKTAGDLIANIQIVGTTLSNNTGTDPVNPAYTYFTGQPNYTAELQAGSTYTVSVSVGSFGNQNVAAWIDYNDNGVFEASERIGFTTTSIGGFGTANFTIALACNPPLGVHRLRIRDVYATAGNTISPCASYGWGETEDYDVTITAADPCPAPTSLSASNVTDTSADLAWTIGCAETAWEVAVQTAGSGVPAGSGAPTATTTFEATDLVSGTAYEYYVRAVCEEGVLYSSWTGPYAFSLPGCSGAAVNPLDNATNVNPEGGIINFAWDAPTTGGEAISYDLYIGTTSGTLTFVLNTTETNIDITGFTYNTEFFWSIVPISNGGEAAGPCPEWSFTTGALPANDVCSGAFDLGALESPITGSTVGYTNTVVASCGSTFTTTAPESFYSILVPNGYTLAIGLTGSNYDSAHTLAYGSCGALTEIICRDTEVFEETWTNTTGADQTAYWIQDGYSSGAGLFILAWELTPPPVVVSSFTPDFVCGEEGGTEVVITGSNFTGATEVQFNGISATSFVVDSYTQITAVLPAGNTEGVITVFAEPSTNGSASSDNALLVNNFPPLNPITGPNTFCMPDVIELSGTPGGGTWSSSDETVATVVGGFVTGVSEGTVTISYTVTDLGCTSVETYEVTVNEPVDIDSFTPSQTIVTGTDATFNVVASGTGLTYQWFAFDGSDSYPIDAVFTFAGETYSGYDTDTLLISGVPADINGLEVFVEVSGVSPCTSETTTPNSILNVGNTGIGSDPVSVTLCDGGSTSFTVVRSGDDAEEDITYQWQYNSDNTENWFPLSDSTIDGMTFSGSNTTVLNVSTITLANDGYRFRARINGPANFAISNPATLNVIEGPSVSTQPENDIVCRAAGTANFSIVTSGEVSGIQWQVSPNGVDTWSDAGTGTSLNVAITGATPVGVTYYRAVVSGVSPCTPVNSDVATLTVQQPTIEVTPSAATYCTPGDPVSLTASGASTYTWSPATGLNTTSGATVLASPATTTVYTVTGVDGLGCSNSTTVTVTVSGVAQATATADLEVVCPGGAVQLSATGTQSFTTPVVTAYNFAATTGTYTNLSPGATRLAAIEADGAISATQSIGFNFNYGGNNYTQFKMSSDGYISLNPSATNNLTNNLASANSTLRPIIAPLWDDLDGRATGGSFAGFEVTGTAPNRVLTAEWRNWEWNWLSTAPVISFQVRLYETTNVVEFIYRSEAGAVSSGSATIGIGAPTGSGNGSYLNLTSVTTPAVSSTTSTTTLNTKPATGTVYRFTPTNPNPFTYSWTSEPAGFTSSEQNPVVNPTEDTTYTVVVSGAGGCSASAEVEVSVVSGATIETQPVSLVQCEGTDATFTVEASGPSLAYQWRLNGIAIDGATNATLELTAISLDDNGTYDVVVTPLCGSPLTSDEVTLTVNPLPVVSASNNGTTCSGETISLSATSDVAGSTFAWSGPNGFASTEQNPTIAAASQANQGLYTVIVTTPADCSSSASTTVSVAGSGELTITASGSPTTACVGELKQLTATAAAATNVILSENFNGGSNGWITQNLTTGGTPAEAAWTLRQSPHLQDVTFSSNDASQFYLSHADDAGLGSAVSTRLQSPTFSTVGYSAVSVSYFHFYRHLTLAQNVEYSVDGVNWISFRSYNATQGTATAFVQDTVALPAGALNQPSVSIRFRYQDGWAWYWAVDNVQINGTLAQPAVTWSPTTDLYTDEGGTVAYTGAPASTVYAKVSATSPTSYTATAVNALDCEREATFSYTLTTTGCPSTTVVQPSQCGVTLETIDSYVYANNVTGAQGYRFRVTNLETNEVQTIDRVLRVFRFTQLTSFAFDTDYSVEVSVRLNGVWQPFYGAACTVSTPDTTTQVQASQCNTTITNLANSVFADIVPFATGYRFRVTNTLNPVDVQIFDRQVREFKMNQLVNPQYNTAYTVEVAVRNTDETYLSYGPACTITTPLFPTTGLQDSQCDEYPVTSNTEILYADSYPGAQQYRFTISNIGLGYSQSVVRPLRTVTLNLFTGLQPSTTYTVRVEIMLDGVWGPQGKSCSIITPDAARPAVTDVITKTNAMGEFNAIAYPNPFRATFGIDVRTSNTENITLTVYDMAGRLLEVKEVKAQDVSNYQFGDRYPSGVYNVIVTQGEETRAVRVVKQ